MKSQEIIEKYKSDYLKSMKELVGGLKNDAEFSKEEKGLFLAPCIMLIRTLEWTLDDEELSLDDYCLKTNYNITKEIGFNVVTGEFL